MSIRIVSFEDRHLDDIRSINLSVSTHPDRPADEKALFQHLYIDYYAIYSKDSCFVALDGEEVVGYIIAEPCLECYRRHFLIDYMPTAISLRPEFEQYLKNEIRVYEKYHNQYDAHLHMDVKPGHQRKGIGTMLIQREFAHLKEIGCKGVMLTVSPSRIGANSFYEKNGMELIGNEGANVRGKKL